MWWLLLLTSLLLIVFEAADASLGHRLRQLLLLLRLRSTGEAAFDLGVSAAVADGQVDISVDLIDCVVGTVDHLRGAGLLAIATQGLVQLFKALMCRGAMTLTFIEL